MLSFDFSDLDARAVSVAGVLAADDAVWTEEDPRPSGGVRVTGRLSGAGPGRFYFSGQLDGVVDSECRRCLTAVSAPVRDTMHVVFAEPGDEDVEGDREVYHLDPRSQQLDLRPAVREQWLLSAPAFVQCRDDCKGLCPSCGADRNAGDCGCAPAAADPRWDTLRSPRSDPS